MGKCTPCSHTRAFKNIYLTFCNMIIPFLFLNYLCYWRCAPNNCHSDARIANSTLIMPAFGCEWKNTHHVHTYIRKWNISDILQHDFTFFVLKLSLLLALCAPNNHLSGQTAIPLFGGNSRNSSTTWAPKFYLKERIFSRSGNQVGKV